MANQNQLSLEELQAISGGFKEGGCIVIRPCFPIPNCPMPTDYPNPQKEHWAHLSKSAQSTDEYHPVKTSLDAGFFIAFLFLWLRSQLEVAEVISWVIDPRDVVCIRGMTSTTSHTF